MDSHLIRSIPNLVFSVFFFLPGLKVGEGVAIDNGVVGEPTISCGTDSISFWVKTQNAFTGKVYVKGEYGKGECSRTFGGGQVGPITQTTTQAPVTGSCPPCPSCPTVGSNVDPLYHTPETPLYQTPAPARRTFFGLRNKRQVPENVPEMAHLTVEMGTCNIKRDRSLQPPGVTITYTVVISFHPNFITKVDKAFQIRCFYMEGDKTVTSQFDVSMPQTTELIAAGATMPVCEYTIRRDTPDGPQVRFARVGDKVFHRWECASEMPEMFGMLVNDCYVSDGQGQRVQIIDEKGCSIDQFGLPDLTYESTLLMSYVESHVFKFADRAALEFQCAISMCIKTDNGCEGITPPACTRANRRRRSLVVERVNKTMPLFSSEKDQWRLSAPPLTIVDLDDKIEESELVKLEQRMFDPEAYAEEQRTDLNGGDDSFYKDLVNNVAPEVCLSVAGFGVLVALSTFVFTTAAVISGTIVILRKQREEIKFEPRRR